MTFEKTSQKDSSLFKKLWEYFKSFEKNTEKYDKPVTHIKVMNHFHM